MPKVKPLIRPDPSVQAVRAWIGAGMATLGLTQKELARQTGIKETTLSVRIGKGGDLGSMKLSELWAIGKVFKRGGFNETVGAVGHAAG